MPPIKNMSNTWYGYYDNSYRVAYSPAYSIDYDITTAETNIYDAKSEVLVWSVMTETAETSKAARLAAMLTSPELEAHELAFVSKARGPDVRLSHCCRGAP